MRPLLVGVAGGAIAYVLGLAAAAAVYAVSGLRPVEALDVPMVGRPGFSGAVFSFYGGHFVPTVVGGSTVNFAFDVASAGVVYPLLVAVVLVAAGFAVGSVDDLDGPIQRSAVGATIAVGYAPLATAGAALVVYRATPQTPAGADAGAFFVELPLVRAALVAGVLVPACYGAAGGLVAAIRSSLHGAQSDPQ